MLNLGVRVPRHPQKIKNMELFEKIKRSDICYVDVTNGHRYIQFLIK